MDRRAVYGRLLSQPDGSFFLFGPRGTGKTTWARRQFAGAHWVDLLDEARYVGFLGDAALFGYEMGDLPERSWVVVDEVQRLPSLLNEVHRFIERGLRFVLLGSSARKLKSAGTNLLAGRAVRREIFPFVPEELGDDFRLDDVLATGSVPLVWASPDRAATLEAYVQLYLREEIRAEALVRNLPAFVRFLPVAALFHGQNINESAIARDSGTARRTVGGYLDILEDTLLATRLSAYESRMRVRERKHPKLYWIDPGIVRAARRQLGPVGSEERGALFEGWVHTLLRAYAQYRGLYDDLHYWSPAEAGFEVDFLLRKGRDLLALEVKAADRFSRSHLRGLRAVADLPRVSRRVLLYTGTRSMRTEDGIEVWPVGRFLEALATDALWP
jgi:predicted AAA+ superfamily ATPase